MFSAAAIQKVSRHQFLFKRWKASTRLEETGMIFQLCHRAIALALPSLIKTSQPSVSPPIAAPLRDLPWGQLNFLHTTDTHGWHAGHLQEYIVSALFASSPMADW